MKTSYSAFIIEDSMEDLDLILYYLNKYCKDIQVVGNASTVEQAIEGINSLQPDIVFSDIQIKSREVFDVFDAVKPYDFHIILISSYKKFALKGFQYYALDYIVKPYALEDLLSAIDRVRKYNHQVNIPTHDHIGNTHKARDFIAVASMKKIEFVKLSSILYCEADRSYTTFFLEDDKKIITSRNLGEYERLLKYDSFYRIHHKYLINLNKVISINRDSGGYCELQGNIRLPVSTRKHSDLYRYLNLK